MKTVEEVDRLSPSAWFTLPYLERLEAVKLFLRREYPDYYPTYTWTVFVLIEDATGIQLRRWEEEGAKPFQPVPNAMLLAVFEVSSRGKSKGYVEETLRAAKIACEKGSGPL